MLHYHFRGINPLNAELNPICYLLALLGAHHFLHVSRIRVNGKFSVTVSFTVLHEIFSTTVCKQVLNCSLPWGLADQKHCRLYVTLIIVHDSSSWCVKKYENSCLSNSGKYELDT